MVERPQPPGTHSNCTNRYSGDNPREEGEFPADESRVEIPTEYRPRRIDWEQFDGEDKVKFHPLLLNRLVEKKDSKNTISEIVA